MTNAKTNQSVEAAQEQMLGFVWENYCLYRQYEELGKEHEAYKRLGRVMHPIMDSTCPLHKGFQIWWGMDDPRGKWHILNEPLYILPKQLRQTTVLMNYTILTGAGWAG